MSWSAVSAIAEIAGLVIIVASLVYLARQVKQNTNAIQSGTRATFLSALQNSNSFALQHSGVWHRGAFAGEELQGEELTRYVTIVHSALNAYEALYSEYLAGNVEKEFWDGKVRQMIWIFEQPSSRYAWKNFAHLFDERFVMFVDENIAPSVG